MENRVPEVRRSISLGHRLVAMGSAVIIGLIFAALLTIQQLRRDAVAETEAANHQLGVVLAEQTERSVQAVDLVLRDLASRIGNYGIQDSADLHRQFGTRAAHEALSRRLADLPQVEAFTIGDAAGALVNLSRTWPLPNISFANGPILRHFRAAPESDIYVTQPWVSPVTGITTVYLARRLRLPDGSFLGLVTAAIRLSYFSELFAAMRLDDGTGVTIVREDGTMLVRSADPSPRAGARVPADEPWYGIVAAGGGRFRSGGPFDTLGPRYVSVHPLRAYGLVVNVYRLESAAFARWRRQAIEITLGTLGATLAFGLVLWAVRRQFAVIAVAQARIREHAEALKAGEARLQTTLDHMNQGLIMVEGDGTISVYNQRAIDLLDLPVALMERRPLLTELLAYQKAQGEFDDTTLVRSDDAAILSHTASYERRRPNGTIIEVHSAPLPGGGMVRTCTDITARAAAEDMLGLAASHDQLTGLANRNGFQNRLDAALAAAQRGGNEVAVLCLDLDRFKAVNDTLGHDAGDRLLTLVAQRMQQVARSTDVLARLGGDEFALVLPGGNAAAAESVAERLLDSIRQPYPLGAETARIGVSIGIALYPADGGTAEQLLRDADSALYRAKAAGRNCWRAHATEDGQREQKRMRLEQDLRAAVELAQFTLAYQPICEATTTEPVAYEALLRWHHASRGAVSPAEFIPIAEQTGLIIPLGRWVIETACAEAATWALPVRVAVNLSPAQFRERDLPGFIAAVLARSGLAATRLDLEVTEGLLLEDTTAVIETMQALRAMGVRMVLDDFGTAHSSLSYLRGFPFDAVKIDRSFMRALNSDRQARALVEAMLAMARALDLEVVGEGVETAEQLALLRHLHCNQVQGYLLGRPAPAEEARQTLWRLATHRPEPVALAAG